MNYRGCFWLAWSAAAACACAGDTAPASLADYTAEMQASIEDVEAELDAHHADVRGRRELGAIAALERRHMEAMVLALRDLRQAQQSAALCGQHMTIAHRHRGLGPFMSENEDLASAIEEGYREVGRHWRAMDEATVLHEAGGEERKYALAMEELVDNVRNGCDAMTKALVVVGNRRSIKCPTYTHMHGR
jgi:hypothetical protein